MEEAFKTTGWKKIAELPVGPIVVGAVSDERGTGLIVDTMIHRRPDRKVYGVRSMVECKATHFHLPPDPTFIKL